MNYVKTLLLGAALSFVIALPMSETASASTRTMALSNPSCASSLLTLPVWYRGLTVSNSDCEVMLDDDPNAAWIIALNLTEALLHVVGYVAGIFVLVGGFRYMTSTGEPDRIANAKKTITNAIVGLVIALFSVAIINFIVTSVSR